MKFEDKTDACETVCVKMHLKEDSMRSEHGNTFTESVLEISLGIILLFSIMLVKMLFVDIAI